MTLELVPGTPEHKAWISGEWTPSQVDLLQDLIEDRYNYLLIDREAKARLNADTVFSIGEVLTVDDVRALPEASWVIQDYVMTEGRTLLAAESRSFKSFLALDWACRLASEGKRVCYLALESVESMRERLCAWQKHNNVSSAQLSGLVFPKDVSLSLCAESDVDALVEWLKEQRFDLVVIDNLNRGGYDNENDAVATAQVVRALDRIRVVAGGVLAVHNFGWGGNRMRGHSKLFDAMDTVIYVTKTGPDSIKIHNPKQKRAREFEDRHFTLTDLPETGSAVLVPYVPTPVPDLVWDALRDAGKDGMTIVEIVAATGVKRTLVQRNLDKYLQDQTAIRDGKGTRGDPYIYRAVALSLVV